MLNEVVGWFKNRIGDDAKARVYAFLQAHPHANTRAIYDRVDLRAQRVTAILAEGVAAGELTLTSGARNAKFYDLAGNHSVDGNQSADSPLAPIPETEIDPVPVCGDEQRPFPAAQAIAPDLGFALLHPGPAFSGSRPIPTGSQDYGKQANGVANVPTPAPDPEPETAPRLADLQRACRAAAEQGIRVAMAQMAAQSKEPQTKEKPVDPVAEGLLGEIKSGARTQRACYMVLQDYP